MTLILKFSSPPEKRVAPTAGHSESRAALAEPVCLFMSLIAPEHELYIALRHYHLLVVTFLLKCLFCLCSTNFVYQR